MSADACQDLKQNVRALRLWLHLFLTLQKMMFDIIA